MCIDYVLASARITQVDPGDGPLPEVVLSQHLPKDNEEVNAHVKRL
jgi:hypothetical protein